MCVVSLTKSQGLQHAKLSVCYGDFVAADDPPGSFEASSERESAPKLLLRAGDERSVAPERSTIRSLLH
jgi:hypothetical protein